jgi:hypothetical protein
MRRWLPLVASVLLLAAPACVTDVHVAPPPELLAIAQTGSDAIDVKAHEFGFDISRANIPAGVATFRVHNEGTVPHEFVIVPVHDGHYGTPVGEIEPFAPGEVRGLRVSLDAGAYRIVCLQVFKLPEGAASHMALGQSEPLKVTG